ncbi:hypothetical protein EV2_045343 [Malus domestica]
MSTPRYPQDNGRAEASNKMILDCLKKSFTNKMILDCQTNFLDVYGHITPPKDEQPNSKEMAISLDLVEEKRKQTITRIAAYPYQLLSSYNKRVKIWQFPPGDLVIRKSFITTRREGSKDGSHMGKSV